MKSKRTVRKKPRRRRRTQKEGLLPLAALIPDLVAAGKAAALGGISCAAGYRVKNDLEVASRKRRRGKINQGPRKEVNSEVEHWHDISIDWLTRSPKELVCSYQDPHLPLLCWL